jgi:hypothetical protein
MEQYFNAEQPWLAQFCGYLDPADALKKTKSDAKRE